MTVLVLSDGHGNLSGAEKAIEAHPEAIHVFYLGDGVEEMENLVYLYPDRVFHMVAGNCDFLSRYPSRDVITLGGVRILFTHGQYMQGEEDWLREAAREEAKLVLCGHTHIARECYRDGVYLVNPGSIARPRDGRCSYALIDLTPQGILPSIVRI